MRTRGETCKVECDWNASICVARVSQSLAIPFEQQSGILGVNLAQHMFIGASLPNLRFRLHPNVLRRQPSGVLFLFVLVLLGGSLCFGGEAHRLGDVLFAH